MKIAFVSLVGSDPWGGSEMLWSLTAKEALRNNHKVFISVFGWGFIPDEIKELQDLGAIVDFREHYQTDLGVFQKAYFKLAQRYLKNSINEYKSLFSFKPQVVLINQGNTHDAISNLGLFETLKSKKIPYHILSQHSVDVGGIYEHILTPTSEIFENAQKLYFVSKRNLNSIRRQLCKKLEQSVLVNNPVTNTGVNLIEYPKTETAQLACVARLQCNFKGQDLLMEALSQPQWKERNWHLNLYGDGPDQEYLVKLSKHYEIEDKITFHGFVFKVTEIWKRNQLMVLPSVSEGSALSLLEAVCCGRPAVTSDVGGNSEWVQDGINGFVAPSSSVNYFSKAMENAWIHKDKWQEMGALGRENALKTLDKTPWVTLLNQLQD